MRLSLRMISAAAVGLLAACGPGASPLPQGNPPPPISAGTTFHKDVQPILQRSCGNCHLPGGIAPFALQTFQDAQPYAGLLAAATAAKTMPPWDAVGTPDCQPQQPWQNDPRLSDADIATLKAWSDAGAPEGDPKDAPPPEPPPATGLPGVQLSLAPTTPYVASGQADEFRCFVLDPKLAQDTYMNGVFVVPGNRAVVHHAVLFTDPTRASAALVDSTNSYDCFGGVNLPKSQVLTVWTPGGVPLELPSNIGTPVTANSLMVLQIHYHPHGQVLGPDTTTVQLRFAPSKPQYGLATFGFGNFTALQANGDGLQPDPANPAAPPQFLIPANVAGHTETMVFTVPSGLPPLSVYGAMAHMHLIGTDLELTVEHPATASAPASTACLLHEPKWNFDWQRLYLYKAQINELPTLNTGDKLTARCTYDNTMNNPAMARLLNDTGKPAPFDVTLGEQTTNEMCIAIIPLLYVNP